jgi:hypothetical protein
VFFKDDTTTQSFLSSIVAKEPEHWARLRKVLADQGDCRLTIVDKSIETPFHCLLAALFCKQLEEQLHVQMNSITLILSPLHKKFPNGDNTANMPFDTTDHRNDFLQECFVKVMGFETKIATKRNPVHCRDVKVSAGDYALYLRFEGGMTNGWQVDDAYVSRLSSKDLLPFALNDVRCRNIFTHGYSQNGVFINVDFLTKCHSHDK